MGMVRQVLTCWSGTADVLVSLVSTFRCHLMTSVSDRVNINFHYILQRYSTHQPVNRLGILLTSCWQQV